ncbi:MAG: alpha/beta fold hydrolase [Pseudomonadota bacterium]|nr:alpha/beta fold hydrolase [Pseudomonadota bacterium]
MKPRHFVPALLLAASLCGHAQVPPEAAHATAEALLDHLDRGEFAKAHAMLDASMQSAISQEQLRQVWQSLGAAGERSGNRIEAQGQGHTSQTVLQRANSRWVATVNIAADGKVSGLWVKPMLASQPAPAVPAYAPFGESETRIGDDARALPATLAMPKGKGPFPAVVLVHGSGAHDRDETIGPNRPFLDIARSLAAQGIAVLRYDKRSQARPGDYAQGVTIDSETTDDALMAVAHLRSLPGIDGERIFVLGHSQGGMMAPRIGQRDDKIAGLILFAAPARNLLDILVEQNARLLHMQGQDRTPAGIAHMQKLKSDIAAVRRGDADARLLNLDSRYWQSVDAVDPLREARASRQPLLILHGGHDIQVVDADWQTWRAAFDGDARASLRHYPRLNHLGMESAAGAGLESYQIPGQVDATLLADISRWIKSLP